MQKSYYRLNPECYLITGQKGFLLKNLYSKAIIPLNKKVGDVLLQAEVNEPVDTTIPELAKLVDMGWAQIYDKPVYIEKIRVTNAYGKKHLWKAAPVIEVATIQLTSKCSLSCADCGSARRCPSCKKIGGEELSKEDWKKIIDVLKLYETKNLIITGGDPTLYKEFDAVLAYAKEKIGMVYVHVPSARSCEKVIGKAGVFYTALDATDISKIPLLLKKGGESIRIFVPEQFRKQYSLPQKGITYVNAENVRISEKNMYSVGIDAYRLSLKQMYNECFYGKLCINARGDILPCLGSNEEPLGNVLDEGYYKAFKKLMEEYWYQSIDDTKKDIKCIKCENRYVCRNICYFNRDNDLCTYNVEEGTWN